MLQAKSINDHIALFPIEVRERLEIVRNCIAKTAPKAVEAISYGIPTFKQDGNLVHFAGYKKHIGFYPGASGIAAFENELKGYTVSKGTVQFQHSEPLPLALITKIVKFRLKENAEKAAAKKKVK